MEWKAASRSAAISGKPKKKEGEKNTDAACGFAAVNCSACDLPDTAVLLEIYGQNADVSYDGDMNRGSRNLLVLAMKTWNRQSGQTAKHRRSGVTSLDYMLVLGIILPLAAFIIPNGKRMIQLVYEMITVLISWPFI